MRSLSIIETCIILVAFVLIYLGVKVGSHLLQSAEIRNIISEVTTLKKSLHQFQMQFGALPGDIHNAEHYWQKQCKNTGNSDGRIDFTEFQTHSIESYNSWCHLAQAGYISGPYKGDIASINTTPSIGKDIPGSIIPSAGYWLGYNLYIPRKNVLILGNPSGGYFANNTLISNGIMEGKDAYTLDKKIDDGLPFSGSVHGIKGYDSKENACSINQRYNRTTYKLHYHACALAFDAGV